MQDLLGNCPSVLAESAVDPSRGLKVVFEDKSVFRPSLTQSPCTTVFCRRAARMRPALRDCSKHEHKVEMSFTDMRGRVNDTPEANLSCDLRGFHQLVVRFTCDCTTTIGFGFN
jgi:hypothetical protein